VAIISCPCAVSLPGVQAVDGSGVSVATVRIPQACVFPVLRGTAGAAHSCFFHAPVQILQACKDTQMELKALRENRDALDDQLQRLEWALRCGRGGGGSVASSSSSESEDEGDEIAKLCEIMENLKAQRDQVGRGTKV
jgi:hypothetical protein